MKDSKPSRTAADVAALRALCHIAPSAHRIMQDELSLRMLPAPWNKVAWLLRGPWRHACYHLLRGFTFLKSGYEGAVELVALRYRHIDDRLANAYRRGFRQVLLLGAGYDYRAYREAYADVHFVEVDHPATQQAKLKWLKRHGADGGARVSYVAVDFMGDWADTLRRSGALLDQPTYVIWEGVAYYLDGPAVEYTLQTLPALLPAGSELIFDCAPSTSGPRATREMKLTARYVADKGEPLLWGGTPEEVRALLTRLCFGDSICWRFSQLLEAHQQADGVTLSQQAVFEQFYLIEVALAPHAAQGVVNRIRATQLMI